MSDARKPKMKETAEDAPLPKPGLEDRPRPAERSLSPEQSYLQRKAEVTQQDHEVFSEYLQEKITREQQQKVQFAEPPPKAPTKVNRRSLLTWAAGTAVVGDRGAGARGGGIAGPGHLAGLGIVRRDR